MPHTELCCTRPHEEGLQLSQSPIFQSDGAAVQSYNELTLQIFVKLH